MEIMINITARLDEHLSVRSLRVRDIDPALLLAGVTFVRTFVARAASAEIDELRRRARREHSVERALLHLLRIEPLVRDRRGHVG